MNDPDKCDECGARFGAEDKSCEYCGAARPVPMTPLAALDALPEPMPGFWWMHGGIFILVGVIFTLTIIGAIVGIPAIIIGINSWKKGARARR